MEQQDKSNFTSEDWKNEGNQHFKKSEWEQAIKCYTEAYKTDSDSPKASIYLSNRSVCQLKMENYGLAIADANLAEEKDPKYVKAYYRQGQALFSLGKLNEARNSFLKAKKLLPNDADIIKKLKLLKDMIVKKNFEEAIAIPDKPKDLELAWEDMQVPSSYDGPKIESLEQELTFEWCVQLMNFMKDQKKLHKKYLTMLLIRAKNILKDQPSLVDLEIPEGQEITVCGDTHGQYYDLLNIFSINGNPSETNPYLFNGDFVDRGSFSVEVIVCLLAWKISNPNCMHLTKGNHETRNMNKLYGFEGEVNEKYGTKTFEIFSDLFWYLPLAYVLNKTVQVNHGGLFEKEGVKLDEIRKIDRFREPPESGVYSDIIWSDPSDLPGRTTSKRGVSCQFGPDVTRKYLEDNGLTLLVRSHEMKQEGYEEQHDGKCITIFSAPNYCDQMGNKGAFIRFKGGEMKPKFTQFSAVEHPKIPPMAYAKSFYNMF